MFVASDGNGRAESKCRRTRHQLSPAICSGCHACACLSCAQQRLRRRRCGKHRHSGRSSQHFQGNQTLPATCLFQRRSDVLSQLGSLVGRSVVHSLHIRRLLHVKAAQRRNAAADAGFSLACWASIAPCAVKSPCVALVADFGGRLRPEVTQSPNVSPRSYLAPRRAEPAQPCRHHYLR